MLTGPFGIWQDLPVGLSADEREQWAERQLAPLLPLVRAGWIEVHHVPDVHTDEFTVIPLDGLRRAFADPALRRDDADDWGVGLTCALTSAYRWRG